MSNSRYAASNIFNTVGDSWNDVNPAAGPSYMPATTQYVLPSDTNVAGFAPGMDDLAQIVLNNKYKPVLNRNAMTTDGAENWVSKKNRTIKDKDKYWKTAYADVNGDEIPEILIKDGQGNIRYINGWHMAKAQNNVDQLFQREIEKQFGLPAERSKKRARGEIPERATSYPYFLYRHLNKDPNYPDGPLIPDPALKSAGYTARAPSPANLLLSHCTKHIYKKIVENPEIVKSPENSKMVKKIFSVIQANALIYRRMVTNVVIAQLNKENKTEKEAKKKHSGQAYSYYTQLCIQKVMSICKGENGAHDTIRKLITAQVNKTINENKYNPAGPIADKYNNEIKWNRKLRPDAGPEGQITVPRINLSNININQSQLDRAKDFLKYMQYEKKEAPPASEQEVIQQQNVISLDVPFAKDMEPERYNAANFKKYIRYPDGTINAPLIYTIPEFAYELRTHPAMLSANYTIADNNHIYTTVNGKKTQVKMKDLVNQMIAKNSIHPGTQLIDTQGKVIASYETAPKQSN